MMIDEDDLPRAIFDYAMKKYDTQLEDMCEKYSGEFPEKDCELSDEEWFKNFLCWLFFEKVLPETGKTIAEEGIDIPNVNRVVFYEPIPSEIRGIQRKGRTGRSHIGNVTILITEGTRDEAYFYVEKRREQRMQYLVREMG